MFKDVTEGHWAKGSIERIAEKGLLNYSKAMNGATLGQTNL
ncbi:hypothetical protein [Desulforamulus aeronauticus]|uniref:Uncharacterized protein n=1 Tax=Desulforamulus aeronauticus DSM 10349 TaxID=1121421 RepID=A0A1M6WS79_9FIRM|nr:hypothetical protein [Desulforamulus aeronauticus]SHK96620.1 hypothetical protein SAMN02745123_03744 [Desulforamulus aeronauticus DSM 10349]